MSIYTITLDVREVVGIESALITAIGDAENKAHDRRRLNMINSAETYENEAARLTALLAAFRAAAYEKATVA